jgi:hypothetical protein
MIKKVYIKTILFIRFVVILRIIIKTTDKKVYIKTIFKNGRKNVD